MNTSQAFHSKLLDPVLDEFEQLASAIDVRPARGTLICNLTGQALATGQLLDGAYWSRHARQPVQFARSVQTLEELGCRVLLEIGPQPVLTGMVAGCWAGEEPPTLSASLRSGQSDTHTLLSALSVEYAWGSKLVAQLQGVHLALLDRRRADTRELMGFLREAHAALVLAYVRLQLLRQTLLITAAAAVDLLHGSFTLAPMVHYKVTDHWRVGVGALIFEGKSDTLFGAWTRNDLLWADVRWSF